MSTNTPLTSRDILEYSIRFIHPEKIFPLFPGMNDETIAAMRGINVALYREIVGNFRDQVRQAAQELLGDAEFAALVDRMPFVRGAKVVGFGSSTTDDLCSWLELLRAVFELRRPQDGMHFVNAGISGDSTTHEIARFAAVVNEQPDWIICHISANDGRRHGISPTRPLVSPEETEKNLLMLRHLAASQTSARWLWMTPTPLIEERIAAWPLFTIGQVMFYNADNARVVDLVRKQPDPVVNLWNAFGHPAAPELLYLDGLHPSLAGQIRILRTLVAGIVQHFAS